MPPDGSTVAHPEGSYQKYFDVANPSKYERSDYVEADMESLDVPDPLKEKSLRLSRVYSSSAREEIPFQIDQILGEGVGKKRVMTFLSNQTPPGDEHYTHGSATFLLEQVAPGTPKDFLTAAARERLRVGHYYKEPVTSENRDDDSNPYWHRNKEIVGVKLCNNALEVYFSLVPHPGCYTPINYSGCATSVRHLRKEMSTGSGEMLAPFWFSSEKAQVRWGQLTQLDLYPFPWERRWYHTEPMLKKDSREKSYTLVWSNSGMSRAVVTLKSEPFSMRYFGKPYREYSGGKYTDDSENIECNLYRVISFFPEKEYYFEQLYLYSAQGDTLAFRAHYYSILDCPSEHISTDWARDEGIPDYYAEWKHFTPHQFFGFGFASDSHVRKIEISANKNEIWWRLQLSHIHTSIHQFMLQCHPNVHFNRSHEIGHSWYENILKPLRVVPLKPYLPVIRN
jgi:hypothetical protein